MGLLVIAVLLTMSLVMTLAWAVQRSAANGGWTDVFWTYGTGVSCAIAALCATDGAPWRRLLVAVMLGLWSGRLGTHVALRVRRSRSEDPRYATLRAEWGTSFQRRMFGLLIIQAPITAVLSLAVIAAADRAGPAVRPLDGLALLVFFVAILGETIADLQLKLFKADPDTAGEVCDEGLWGWSRHPNYFFEVLIWVAYPIMGVDTARPWTWAALLAPVMMFWIVRFATGVPPLERAMLASKGEAYRRYQARVSTLLPRPPHAAPKPAAPISPYGA